MSQLYVNCIAQSSQNTDKYNNYYHVSLLGRVLVTRFRRCRFLKILDFSDSADNDVRGTRR